MIAGNPGRGRLEGTHIISYTNPKDSVVSLPRLDCTDAAISVAHDPCLLFLISRFQARPLASRDLTGGGRDRWEGSHAQYFVGWYRSAFLPFLSVYFHVLSGHFILAAVQYSIKPNYSPLLFFKTLVETPEKPL